MAEKLRCGDSLIQGNTRVNSCQLKSRRAKRFEAFAKPSAVIERFCHSYTICIWDNHDAEEAAQFYTQAFPDSKVTAVRRPPSDYPVGTEDKILTVELIGKIDVAKIEAAVKG
ncbi:hypothetical protein BH11CYA1_BH11CYA1_49420 [soil metagenome]